MSGPQRYPLEWPVGEPRTPEHSRAWGQFRVTFARARTELLHELMADAADERHAERRAEEGDDA